MKTKFVSLLLSCLFVGQAWAAGPFGFEWGMTKDQVIKLVGQRALKPDDGDPDDLLTLTTAPKPHPNFEVYLLTISPQRGLVKLSAIGTTIATTRDGDTLKDRFNEISNTLRQTYGTPLSQYDFADSGSIWNQPEYWMMGLLKHERRLTTFWKLSEDPKHIDMICLEAKALTTTTGYLILGYEFEGFNEYNTLKKEKADTAF